MTLFDLLTMLGGLSLFLFGMNIMGQALERSAGNRLQQMLERMTSGKAVGLLTGIAITAVIQSSSATTVMVVGFVNSGLMTLRQSIHVIMGANIGTTVTAWILSLGGISGDNLLLQLLKPTSFTPILALIGIILYLFVKNKKRQDVGLILLGFATLMFGMSTMTDAVSGLAEEPAFRELFLVFRNPLLGLLAGALLTAILQSSSASVGILQALAVTGSITYGAAIPIIMGQNVGTCVTALLSSIGANKNARRAAFVHLSFNLLGSFAWLSIYAILDALLAPALFDQAATLPGIAAAHTVFNLLCTLLLLPAASLLERLVCWLIPDGKAPDATTELDERLLATPTIALEHCRDCAVRMMETAVAALGESTSCLERFDKSLAASVHRREEETDRAEDALSSYLLKLSTHRMEEQDSALATVLLKVVGDFELIADHAVDIVEAAAELEQKKRSFSEQARQELDRLCLAVDEILSLTLTAIAENDAEAAGQVEPLEQVIDRMREQMRTSHMLRLQRQDCSMETGFIWSDLLTALSRTSDHCSNVAGCVIDLSKDHLTLHRSLRITKQDSAAFREHYRRFSEKYL